MLRRLARRVVAEEEVAGLLAAPARRARQLRSGERLMEPIRHLSERLRLQWREVDLLMHSLPLPIAQRSVRVLVGNRPWA